MTKTTWLITGASRGLGLEFTRQLAASEDNTIFATCRDPSTANLLKDLVASDVKGTIHTVKLDHTSEESITNAAKEVGELLGPNDGLDYLLNNAAANYASNDQPSILKAKPFLDTVTANVLGPALVTQGFFPYIERSQRKVVMNMTSGLGSIGIDAGVKSTSYSISKVGINMLTYKQMKERPDVIFVTVDPGWNKTDMGGAGATLEPEYSVGLMLKVLKGLKPEDSGKFLRYNGSTIPW